MTPDDRLDDCHSIMVEIAQTRMPWFCTDARYSQIASAYSAGQFGSFVRETERVGNPLFLWRIISEKLGEWSSETTH
jgi:hypothetical protein